MNAVTRFFLCIVLTTLLLVLFTSTIVLVFARHHHDESYSTTIRSGVSVIDGDNVPVKRYIGRTSASSSSSSSSTTTTSISQVSPFLVFDWYNLTSSSSSSSSKDDSDFYYEFPAHIHDGFLEIRYLLKEEDEEDNKNEDDVSSDRRSTITRTGSRIEHRDNCEGRLSSSSTPSSSASSTFIPSSVLQAGGFHVLNTIGGIAHEERLYLSSSSSLRGFQLWFDVSQHYEEFHSRKSKKLASDDELKNMKKKNNKRKNNNLRAASSPLLDKKAFHETIPREEIPEHIIFERLTDDDDVDEIEMDDESRTKRGGTPRTTLRRNPSTLKLKCLGYFYNNPHQSTMKTNKLQQQQQRSVFDRFCSSAPINKDTPSNNIFGNNKDKKKNKKYSSSSSSYSSKVDFGQFFDYFLMIELQNTVVSKSISSSLSKTVFRYPIVPEFKATDKITCLTFFAFSTTSSNINISSPENTLTVNNDASIKSGDLHVEVLHKKDFVQHNNNDDDVFYYEMEVPTTASSRVFHVCAASSASSASSSTFQANGLVYHTKKELDESLKKMEEGNFQVNC